MNESIPEEQLITQRNWEMNVEMICFFKVFDAQKTVGHADDVREATKQVLRSTLGHVLGASDFDQLDQNNKRLSSKMKTAIDTKTAAWGVKVTDLTLNLEKIPDEDRVAHAISIDRFFQVQDKLPAVTCSGEHVQFNQDEIVPTAQPGYRFARSLADSAHNFVAEHIEPTAHDWGENHHHYSFGHHTYDFGHEHYKFGHEIRPNR